MVSRAVPEAMGPQLREVVDNVTEKLGGDPVQPAVVEELLPRRDVCHNGHHNEPADSLM